MEEISLEKPIESQRGKGTGKRKHTPHSNNYNSTGYKGVYPRKRDNGITKYDSYVTISGVGKKNVSLYLGCFETAPEAYLARIEFLDSLK